jgi:hypothetical protein
LSDDQAGLDRLPQANLVGKNATTFAQTPKCENYGVNLVRIGINARLALRCGIPLSLSRLNAKRVRSPCLLDGRAQPADNDPPR